jgi:hypothetical protein
MTLNGENWSEDIQEYLLIFIFVKRKVNLI